MRYGSVMSTITLKNVPEDLHGILKQQAQTHGRSLNKEIISVLQGLFCRETPDRLIEEAHAVRESMGVYLTCRELNKMKEKGRR
jgi:plasmid stability protein